MGLAATQARFLAVTSRKANCEFRSMELAQQKLSLSRELQEATEQYQDSLNATQLIWDADGTGDYRYQLSYDLMMNPSDLNSFTPYMLSRQDGKIALDDKFVKAVSSIFHTTTDPVTGVVSSDGGIYRANGTVAYRGDDDFDDVVAQAYIDFIDGLQKNRAISGSIVNKIVSTDAATGDKSYTYIADAGVGGVMSGKETSNMMDINSVLSYIDLLVENAMSGYYPAGSDEAILAEKLIFDFDYYDVDKKEDYSCHLNTSYDTQDGSTCLMVNGDYCNEVTFDSSKENNRKMNGSAVYTSRAVTLADILNEDVSLLVTGRPEINKILEIMEISLSSTETMGHSSLITKSVNDWYNDLAGRTSGATSYETLVSQAENNDSGFAKTQLALINYFDKLAKSMYALFMPETPDQRDSNAFYLAMQDVITRLRNNVSSGDNKSYEIVAHDYQTGAKINSEEYAKNAVAQSDKYNCWVADGNEWAISLSNLTEACLTNFINGMDDYQDGCLITKRANTSTYITDDSSYLYLVNTTDDSQTGLWQSEFYSAIFNNLCAVGWYENEQVGDKTYLDNALKNGQLFVSSMANDNYYYQSRYTQAKGGHIMQETDDAAIAAAEREYIYAKNKINYKEEQIEVESKNVDAELQALSTEYETVKTLIKNNIDKTFRLFQS